MERESPPGGGIHPSAPGMDKKRREGTRVDPDLHYAAQIIIARYEYLPAIRQRASRVAGCAARAGSSWAEGVRASSPLVLGGSWGTLLLWFTLTRALD